EGMRNSAILVPQQAVQRDPKGEASVWVVNGQNQAERRIVTTERTVGNQWLVSSGLKSGERVVTEGLQRLRDAMEVVATEAGNVSVVADFRTEAAVAANQAGAVQADVADNPAQVAVKQ